MKYYEWIVYGDKDEDGGQTVEWDVDVHVKEHKVQPGRRQGRRRSEKEAT